jgi:voltage-gated potassium channel
MDSPARVRRALDVAAILGGLATIPLTVLQEHGVKSLALEAMDWSIWGIFAIEFLVLISVRPRVRLLRASTVLKFAVVALSFPRLPNLLSLVRLARLVRPLRLVRLTGVTAWGMGAMKEILGRRGLLHVAAITTLLILVGGGCLSILEPETVKGGFGDGIWWAIVTATTVGYGDISPSTLWGRIIAALLMLVGIGLMSTLAASITSYFVQQTGNTEFKELSERLDRIEKILKQQIAERLADREVRPVRWPSVRKPDSLDTDQQLNVGRAERTRTTT